MSEPILSVRNLRTYFQTEGGLARAVDGVSFSVDRGETLGLVGESGGGKSVTSLCVMRLIPSPPGRIEEGRIDFNGKSLLELSEEEMRKVRGNDIAMIFQEPMTSLNPVFTCGYGLCGGWEHAAKELDPDLAAEHVEHVIRVHRRENKMPCQRRLNRDLSRFSISDFPDHNLVWIMPQN